MVGVLCEVGFLTNEKEYNKLLSDSYQQDVAEAIARQQPCLPAAPALPGPVTMKMSPPSTRTAR